MLISDRQIVKERSFLVKSKMASWHFLSSSLQSIISLFPFIVYLPQGFSAFIRASASDKPKDSWKPAGSRVDVETVSQSVIRGWWCCTSQRFVIPPPWLLNEHRGQQKTLVVGWDIWSSFGEEAAIGRGNESCQHVIIASEQDLVQNTGLWFFLFKHVVAVIGGLGTVHGWQ